MCSPNNPISVTYLLLTSSNILYIDFASSSVIALLTFLIVIAVSGSNPCFFINKSFKVPIISLSFASIFSPIFSLFILFTIVFISFCEITNLPSAIPGINFVLPFCCADNKSIPAFPKSKPNSLNPSSPIATALLYVCLPSISMIDERCENFCIAFVAVNSGNSLSTSSIVFAISDKPSFISLLSSLYLFRLE